MIKEIKVMHLGKIILLAILLRIILMPFFYHPDIKTYHFQAQFLHQGIWNIYSFLSENKQQLPLKDEFVYFPLSYFFLGSYQTIMLPFLGPHFIQWLGDATGTATQAIGVFRYLFLLKLPYLVFDLLIGVLLMQFFVSEKNKTKALIYWLFNPFSILAIYVFGNLDVIPAFLSVLSLWFMKKDKPLWAALMLGFGAGFKAYPLLFVPLLVLAGKDYKEKVLMAFISLGVFIAIIFPFIIKPGFSEAALISGLTTRIIFPGISIGFGQTLMISVVAISGLFFFSLSRIRFQSDKLWQYYLAILLLVISSIHFHIQWLLWLMPFLIILIVTKKQLLLPVILMGLVAFGIPFLYEDKFMSVSLFSAISSLYNLLPVPFGVIQKIYDPYILQSVLQSTFMGASLVIVWQMFKDEVI